ncbi:universal stress protein [Actinospica sp. MGRD01-02]|uniref:Universal stress protein n=1 Tax=Actinospica acidithermotolerans TaxID=2828514 RepID=A0A941EAL8_9ACTN|nr:universal stress protein [Actinospica acidithermotolerans]MBR7828031.1 universal stress protein [Actinospica acidithermotolerans]
MAAGATGHAIRRIIAGVDGSDSAMHAALWAAREARCRGVPLLLTHALHMPEVAVPPIEPADYAQKQQRAGSKLVTETAAKVSTQFPDVVVEAETSLLSPVHRLSDVSAPDQLVVTGTRGHGGFVGMLIGSVSRALAMHARGPIVVVRGPEPEHANGPVVLGVGLDPNDSAIEFAFEAARCYGAPLRVVRAWVPPMPVAGLGLPGAAAMGMAGGPGALPTPSTMEDSDEQEADDAMRAVEPFRRRYPDVQTEIVAHIGNAVPVLTGQCAATRLIVVGAHRRHGPFAVGAGYVVEGLLAHSPVPVAVVPVCASDGG